MRVCAQCGAQFFASSSDKQRYCARPCFDQARLSGKSIRRSNAGVRCCDHCGNEYSLQQQRPGGARYCSMACKGLASRTNLTRTCHTCGKSFEANPARLKYSKHAAEFCSHACRGSSRIKPLIPLTCAGCGQVVTVHARTMKGGRRRFCSKACKYAYANPSGIELEARSILDRLGVAYEVQKRVGRWYADLYVPDQHTVIEINGCFYHSCESCGRVSRNPNQPDRDRRKAEWLEAHGYRLVVIWEHTFRNNGAEQAIIAALTNYKGAT